VCLSRLTPDDLIKKQRLMSIPEEKEISGTFRKTNVFDLITLSFSMPTDIAFTVFGRDEKKFPFGVRNDSMLIMVKPPEITPEGIEHEYEIETTTYPTFWEVVSMDRNEFAHRCIRLSLKPLMIGLNKVYLFKSENCTGIIWIGEHINDATTAQICLTDLSGDIRTFFELTQKQNDFETMTNVLYHIVGSIKFDINRMKELEDLEMY
jgi:hypothetical protein